MNNLKFVTESDWVIKDSAAAAAAHDRVIAMEASGKFQAASGVNGKVYFAVSTFGEEEWVDFRPNFG